MVVRYKSFMLGCAAALLFAQLTTVVEAQPRYASKERSHTAVAHYARARAMCVETLEEFEAGRRFARPDLLLDAEEWRLTLISLCEKLNRLVDPKIRISTQGVQVASNPRMVRRAKDRLPAVTDGPEPRNDVGEEKRLQQKQEQRARMFAPTQRPAIPPQPTIEQEVVTQEPEQESGEVDAEAETPDELVEQEVVEPAEEAVPTEEELLEQALQEATAIAEQDAARNAGLAEPATVEQEPEPELAGEEEISNEEIPPQTEVAEIPPPEAEPPLEEVAPVAGATDERGELTEDEQIAVAIEQAIQEKLRTLDGEDGTQPAGEENLE